MRVWIYVLAIVVVTAGAAGLAAGPGVGSGIAEVLLVALLVSAVAAAVKALLRARSMRLELKTRPGSRSRAPFPEQRV